MRYNQRVFLKIGVATLLTGALSFSSVTAQECISATGSQASGNGGSASYTIGQALYVINTGTNGTEAQGVQQPFEIMVLKTKEEANGINLAISAYLATTGYLELSIADLDVTKFSYELFDLNGKLLELRKLEGNPTKINMNIYPTSVYLIRILEGENQIKTFKVLKK